MKSKTLQSIILIIGVVMFYSGFARADSLKIAYFDLQTVLDQSKWGKQAADELKRKQESLRTKVDKKANTFKEMMEEFEKKRSLMDEAARTKKLKELQDAKREGEKTLMESSNELSKFSSELSAPIIKKILDIVKKIAQEEDYNYVFEAQKSGIAYASDKDDLTKRIIKELDKAGPRK